MMGASMRCDPLAKLACLGTFLLLAIAAGFPFGCGNPPEHGTAHTPAPAVARANSYTTDFPLAEDPISEGGHWINGKSVALDWGDIFTTPGRAIGVAGPARYADAT